MLRKSFIKYYRVFKNATAVTEVSANDFKPFSLVTFKSGLPLGQTVDALISIPHFKYALPADDAMYYGYLTRVEAMEKAKAGALTYINKMIKDVEQGISKLKTYRMNHYEDLNTNLLDASIRRVEQQMNSK